MGERNALGKGLAALLGDRPSMPEDPAEVASVRPRATDRAAAADGASPAGVRLIPVPLIQPNPDQPREHMEAEALQELAASITQDGMLQPVVVRAAGDQFVLIAGERRWRAAQLAGLELVPALVHDLRDPSESLRLALIENIQRRDLNPLEEARAYQELIRRCGLTQEQLAKQVSRSRSAVTNLLRLLNLPREVQAFLAQGKLSMGHARALLAADTDATMQKLAQRIVADGLSVREVERLIAGAKLRKHAPARPGGRSEPQDPYYASLEAELRTALGTKVEIRRTGESSGRIAIEYYSAQELEGILHKLGIGIQD